MSHRKFRYMVISNFRYIVSNVFCPPSGIPVFFMLMMILNENFDVSNIEIVSTSFFVCRYHIELNRFRYIVIVMKSIPIYRYRTEIDSDISVSYRNRFRYIGNESNSIPTSMPNTNIILCLLYTSPSPRDKRQSRMPSSA